MSKPPTLTTTFTPSPSCLSYLYATTGTAGTSPPFLAINQGPPTDYSTCFPSGWATNSMSYFSPGICPSGYTSACSTLSSLPPITSGETTVICCPSGYTCGTFPYPWQCTSSITGSSPATVDLFTANSKSGSVTHAFGGANAFSVQIRFQATDFASMTTGGPYLTSTAPADAPTEVHPRGLSTGAMAGIGVGAAIGLLALVLLGALFLVRRRRKSKTDRSPAIEQTLYGLDTKQELDGAPYATPGVKDVSTPPIAELDASEPRLDSTSSRPGTRTQDPIESGEFAAPPDAEPQAQASLTSVEPSSLVVPHAQPQEAVSSVTHLQEPAESPPETGSAVSAPHESGLTIAEGEHEVREQIKRIREEKLRLKRINELERLEAELQERLTGLTTVDV